MASGKLGKRILSVLGVIITVVFASVILIPILFKDKILTLVKKEMNEQLVATANFKDVNLSLFRHFPNLSVGIEELSIVGKEPFAGDTLIAAERIDISLDIMKALSGTYDILSIDINTPHIHAFINEQGKTNWDITKPTPPSNDNTPVQPFAFKLRHYAINHAYIEYNDEQGKMKAVLVNLTHSGSGNFTSDLFTLKTSTTIDALSYTFGGVPYLVNTKTSVDADIDIDNKTSKYTFNTDKIQLNGLKMSTSGFVQMPDTTKMIMDIQFKTPSNDFKDILSMVPGIYQNNFKDVKTTGTVALNGFIKGTYTSKQMPAYEVNLSIQNGSFQYPSLPDKVSDIQIKLQAKNNDGNNDHTVVNIEKGHIVFGKDPFDFRLLLKTPVSNPWIDASMKGRIDLSQMEHLMKLEAGTKMSGIITADVTLKGSISAATQQHYDQLYAVGTVGINQLNYVAKDYPDGVQLNTLLLTFNPKNVTVDNLKGQYQKINFTGNGSIDNLLGYYLHQEALTGNLNIKADKIDVNKLMGQPTTPPAAKAPPTPPFVVPGNLNLTLSAEVGSVIYDKLTLSDLQGTLNISDQAVNMKGLTAKGLDGTIKMDGYYSTKLDKKHPDIYFSYDLQSLDIQKTYNTFVTVQKLMPIGKSINGKLSSKLTVKGKVGDDMAPIFSSLSGKGDLFILQGVLSSFPVVDQLADKLKMNQLKQIVIKDSKTFFTFENGRVTLAPFTYKNGDITMEIAGSHGFDQSIQYGMNMMVPRSAMGSQGNALIDNLTAKAAGSGVPVKVGDKVNLAIKIGGTFSKPTIETNLKDVAGNAVNDIKKQIANEVQKKADSVKNVVKDTIKAVKNQVVNEAKNEVKNAVNNQLNGTKDTAKKNNALEDAKNKAKDKFKGLFK
jgi:AsmA-like C-terminal region/AsmA family